MLGKAYIIEGNMYFTMEEGIAFSHKGIRYPFGNFLTSLPSLPTAFFTREFEKTGKKLEVEFFMCEMDVKEMCLIHNIDDLIRYELLHLVTNNYTFRKCQHCGFFFVPVGRADSKYCDRYLWGETKPCNKIGASRKNQSKIEKDPLLLKSQRVYKKFHNRLDRNKHNLKMKEDFYKWKYEMAEKRSAYLCGELSAEEFEIFLEKG